MSKREISSDALAAVTMLLRQYYPGLQTNDIPKALDAYFSEASNKTAIPTPPPSLLTLSEAADRLKVSLPTVNRMLNDGRLTRFKTSRKLARVTEESLNRLIASANNQEVPND